MPDLSNPLLIPTNRATGRAVTLDSTRDAPATANVLAAYEAYYRRRPVYGRPSEQYATGINPSPRDAMVNVQEYHVAPPDRAEFQRRQVVWRGAPTNTAYRQPLGNDVDAQRHRTFGGFGAPYYQALQAPSLNDVARYMGGIINAHS